MKLPEYTIGDAMQFPKPLTRTLKLEPSRGSYCVECEPHYMVYIDECIKCPRWNAVSKSTMTLTCFVEEEK